MKIWPWLLLLSGCVTYGFEPVDAQAVASTTTAAKLYGRVSKPNLLFVVDRSSSMNEAVGASGTRWTELQGAMGSFLSNHGELARMGLLFFPSPGPASTVAEQCSVPSLNQGPPIPQIPDEAAQLRQAAEQVGRSIQSATPGGGTPTAQTLRLLSGMNTADGRSDVVLLLTDGLPNCNADHVGTCTCLTPPCAGETARAGCLDDDETVSAVRALRDQEILVVVVGFGSTVNNPEGTTVLNRVAEQGGLGRSCLNANDCGAGDVCEAGECGRRFYRAANGTELVAALEAIAGRLPQDPCDLLLDHATDDPFGVTVEIKGTRVPAGSDTWSYVHEGGQSKITFTGSLCEQIRGTLEANALSAEVRVLQAL